MFVSGREVGHQLCKDWGLEGVRDIVIRLPLDGVASIEMDCLLLQERAPFIAEVVKKYALAPLPVWTFGEPAVPDKMTAQLCWTWDGVNVSLHYWGRHHWTKVEGGQPLRPILAWQTCPAPHPPSS